MALGETAQSGVPEVVSDPAVETFATHREHLFPWVKPYYAEPLVLSEGEGVWVRDARGKEYLDFFAGILTTSVGHCHPEVVSAVEAQVRRLGHTSTLYVTEQQIVAAKQLARLSPGDLRRSAFTNSGTEANETAIAAACIHTGRSEVIALRYAYSGRSALTTNLTGHASWRPLPTQTVGVTHARAPYVYRSPLGDGATEEEHTDFFIDDLVEVIETTTSGRPAALIAETILGVGGFVVPPPGYLNRAAEVIRSYGGLFISDEVQTGFGRTGGAWFGIEHEDVVPDIMVMAKGIANGFPVGATITTDEIAESWSSASISTFGGNPVCMAAAVATMTVMEEEDVPARCTERGDQVRHALDALATQFDWIGDVRGSGLMQAMEIVEDAATKEPGPRRAREVMEAAKEEGLLVGLGGRYGHVLRIGPSMLITAEEVDDAVARLERACRTADGAA
jgi:4-aminobutyrate aminotransferase-like enzyme